MNRSRGLAGVFQLSGPQPGDYLRRLRGLGAGKRDRGRGTTQGKRALGMALRS